MRGKRFALSVMGALVLAVAAPAQLVIGPDSLHAGGDAHISYSDPGRAGLKILVEIDNSSPLNPLYDSVIIQLDGNGEGSAQASPIPSSSESSCFGLKTSGQLSQSSMMPSLSASGPLRE